MNSILFFNHSTDIKIPQKKYLIDFINRIFKIEQIQLEELNIIFCNDNYLVNLNKIFLKKSTFSDVITFDLSTNKKQLKGEIYISVDRIKENSKKFHTSYLDEVHRIMFHGVLHLCGYRDKFKKERDLIRIKENFYLTQYFHH